MKKISIFIVLLCIAVSNIYAQGTKVYVDWKGQLSNTPTNKYPSETKYIDFSEFANYVGANLIMLNVSIDSIKCNGISPAVQIRYVPIYVSPFLGLSDSRLVIDVNDTLIGGAIIEDSLESVIDTKSFTIPLKSQQYKFIIETNYADTSNISGTADINYFCRVYLSSDSMFLSIRDSTTSAINILKDSLASAIAIQRDLLNASIISNKIGKIYRFSIVDTLGNSNGRNQYTVDTLKFNLRDSLGIEGIVAVQVKWDSVLVDNDANLQGKPPAIAVGWGWMRSIDSSEVMHPDSTVSTFFYLEDSLKHYNTIVELPIDFNISDGINILIKYNDADTTTTLNTRKTKITTELVAR